MLVEKFVERCVVKFTLIVGLKGFDISFKLSASGSWEKCHKLEIFEREGKSIIVIIKKHPNVSINNVKHVRAMIIKTNKG